MNLIRYAIFFTFILHSCSHTIQRGPASSPLSQCHTILKKILSTKIRYYRPLKIPEETTRYEMFDLYNGEESSIRERPIKYLSKKERKPYEVFIDKNGLVVDSQGLPLTSPMNGNRPYEAIYVISPKGRFYASYLTPDDLFQHSSFLSGGDVIAAGGITFHKGTIQTISNASGHYYPPVESLKTIVSILEKRKVRIMNVFIAHDRSYQ
jgi:hypothetical protein